MWYVANNWKCKYFYGPYTTPYPQTMHCSIPFKKIYFNFIKVSLSICHLSQCGKCMFFYLYYFSFSRIWCKQLNGLYGNLTLSTKWSESLFSGGFYVLVFLFSQFCSSILCKNSVKVFVLLRIFKNTHLNRVSISQYDVLFVWLRSEFKQLNWKEKIDIFLIVLLVPCNSFLIDELMIEHFSILMSDLCVCVCSSNHVWFTVRKFIRIHFIICQKNETI